MQMIGDPTLFAVQLSWSPDPETYKPWMYGTFCVYICGQRLGLPTNQVTLNSTLAELDLFKERLHHQDRFCPDLIETDPLRTFLSIENSNFGLEHLKQMLPEKFIPYFVPSAKHFQILWVDGLEAYNIYCVENDTISRLLYARSGELPPTECRIPRKIFNDVMFRTIDQLEEWFSQLHEDPARK